MLKIASLSLTMDRLVSKNQSDFIKGRYIPERVVTAHEVIYSIARSNNKGVVLKLDYEKALDRVDLDFLHNLLKIRV